MRASRSDAIEARAPGFEGGGGALMRCACFCGAVFVVRFSGVALGALSAMGF